MARRRSNSGSAMVLESRHLVGVFLVAVVLGGVFFTLGYILGRSQQVEAKAAGARSVPGLKAAEPAPQSRSLGTSPSMEPVIAPADWDFYKKAAETKPQLTPVPPLQGKPFGSAHRSETSGSKTQGRQDRPSGRALEKKSKPSEPPQQAARSAPAPAKTILQVAALKNLEDARHLAARLKRKHYAAFVVPPSSDTYYRVQVGPFADGRAAEAVRKKLEQDGFQAIVKH